MSCYRMVSKALLDLVSLEEGDYCLIKCLLGSLFSSRLVQDSILFVTWLIFSLSSTTVGVTTMKLLRKYSKRTQFYLQSYFGPRSSLWTYTYLCKIQLTYMRLQPTNSTSSVLKEKPQSFSKRPNQNLNSWKSITNSLWWRTDSNTLSLRWLRILVKSRRFMSVVQREWQGPLSMSSRSIKYLLIVIESCDDLT